MPDPRDLRGRPFGGPREPQIRREAAPREPQTGGPRMPHRTRAEERAAEIDISPTKLLADIEQLKAELGATSAKADEFLALLQRERAEFANYRRRTSEEREAMLGLAGEDLIRKVLAVADDFDRAIEARPANLADDAWSEGVAAIDRKLRQLLESEGVTT